LYCDGCEVEPKNSTDRYRWNSSIYYPDIRLNKPKLNTVVHNLNRPKTVLLRSQNLQAGNPSKQEPDKQRAGRVVRNRQGRNQKVNPEKTARRLCMELRQSGKDWVEGVGIYLVREHR